MKLKITVNDKLYEVEVEASEPEPQQPVYLPPTPTRIGAAPVVAPPAPAGGPPVENEDKVCRSPIAGTVTRVLAQPGQTIQPGDVLLVLEAMKMETNITAPIAGKIASLPVKAGDAVQGGQVLVAFE
ncbi:MAG: acetyl-CoA carboxylase biotin carboxyl carrier protein subunit [Acidobacteria bacterium]|nr:acetyl-CoA carboxylase biotin carboxyl carrier protein subunit [Acidobacteriota bacterium]